ncbi:hypothetical protein PsYK624_131200 [Phanerochaete sordida]|uniref:Uncharacterized protein n=1 Tax=Phanerochaete sordida TaxID=48140 RepID=A0A9P3LK57_9APHY|nr:hypothetical protein PsYK624_131200 [Phanerochaete sordida]
MQLSIRFTSLAVVVLAVASVAVSTPLQSRDKEAGSVAAVEAASYTISHEEMMHWLATTDAELTFVGTPPNPLAARDAQDTLVTYCANVNGNACAGPCTVYSGGATCLYAAGTNCLSATRNVAFCSSSGCSGSCTTLDNCIKQLDGGFCYTPSTQSIAVLSS